MEVYNGENSDEDNQINYEEDDLLNFHDENLSGAEEAEEDNTLNEDGELIHTKEPKPVKVKRPVLNPQPKLNFEALQGQKGLLVLNEMFKNFKFRGNGFEKEDLSEVLKQLEQWTFRLFPKYHFEDSLKRLESLGKKREVQVYLKKIRQGMLDNDDVIHQVEDDNEIEPEPDPEPILVDAFDTLLSQQIQSQTSANNTASSISEEALLRIQRNRDLAIERRMKMLSAKADAFEQSSSAQLPVEETMDVNED